MDKLIRKARKESGLAYFERTHKRGVYTDSTTPEYAEYTMLKRHSDELLQAYLGDIPR